MTITPSAESRKTTDALHSIALIALIVEAFEVSPEKSYALTGARKIYRGTRGRRIHSFTSQKAGGMLHLEGALEFAHAIYLERAPNVRRYMAQSPRIPLPSGGHAYPDFVIETVHGTYEIHEIKPDLKNLSGKDKIKFSEMDAVLSLCNVVFKKFDQDTIFTKKEAEKLNRLYQNGNLKEWSEYEINLSKMIISENLALQDSHIYTLLEEQHLSPTLLDYHLFRGIRDFASARVGASQ